MPNVFLNFRPHPLLKGGHRQTCWSLFDRPADVPYQATQRIVLLPDGDAVVLHDDQPDTWAIGDPIALLLHGLCGCHGSSYMIRLAERLQRCGVRTFRLDMRGCGAAKDLCTGLMHAGRSDDVLAALNHMVRLAPQSPLWAIGISLGGNQLLKGLGELADGTASIAFPLSQIQGAVAVSPPVDLDYCSNHMQRMRLRVYNRYFIGLLLKRLSKRVRRSEAFQQLSGTKTPRTIRELDDQITAPYSGFQNASDYYQQSSARIRLSNISTRTLVLASQDDPIVPITCYQGIRWSESTTFAMTRHGGHIGYVGNGNHRYWMDRCLVKWLQMSDVPDLSLGELASNFPCI